MTSTHRFSHWFEYFPENHMWSQGMMFGIEMQTWGAASISEIDQIGQRLRGHVGNNERWWLEWTDMARRIEGFGNAAAAEGRMLTAAAYWLRAGTYYFCGERFIPPSERKWATYRDCLRSFRQGLAVRYPNISVVQVPYEDTTLPAYFVKAANVPAQAPAVVMFDGLDNAKEMSVLFGAIEIANRGLHVLAIDGPGQGEALRLQGIPSRYDYEVPATAALDYLCARGDIDPARVAVMGFSMGGYYAPRAAAMQPRFAACVAWGGHFDYHESWQRRLKIMSAGGTKLSAPGFQLPWVLGRPDIEACMKKLEDYRLQGIAEKMTCPFYCVHGENDNIVQLDFAQRLYDAVGSTDKTLDVLTVRDGGSEHCQEDNRQVGANRVADWLAQRLGGRLA
jgi:dipeptidyl aminopeptidase/acylaminoacyl peptidase